MRFLIVFSLAFLSLGIQAQVFDAGLFAGFLATQVNGDAVSGFDKAGLAGGGFVKAQLSDRIALRLEIGYAGKGSRKPAYPDANDFSTWGYTFHYMDVPVMLEYDLPTGAFFYSGPYTGVLISGSQYQDGVEYEIANPPMKSYDLGFTTGAGYELESGLFGMVRYSMSLLPIRPSPDPGNQTRFYDGGMSNICVHFTLGYNFNGG